jgi:hypothetical protein
VHSAVGRARVSRTRNMLCFAVVLAASALLVPPCCAIPCNPARPAPSSPLCSKGLPVTLDIALPRRVPTSTDELRHLEAAHQVAMLWLWLSYRFDPEVFPLRDKVRSRAAADRPTRPGLQMLAGCCLESADRCVTPCPPSPPKPTPIAHYPISHYTAPVDTTATPPCERRSKPRLSTSAACWTRACSA